MSTVWREPEAMGPDGELTFLELQLSGALDLEHRRMALAFFVLWSLERRTVLAPSPRDGSEPCCPSPCSCPL